MPNFDELLGLINPAQGGVPVAPQPQPEPENDLSSLLRAIDDIKNQNKDLDTKEDKILKSMGVSPRSIQARMIEEDKPKGFWKTLGKYGSEALLGAVSGKGYVPYSDRMYGKAMDEYSVNARANEKQLASVTQQKNKLTDTETKLRQAAARMGVDYDKLALQKDGLNLKRSIFDAGADQRAANVNKTNAQTDLIGSQAQKVGADTENVLTKTNILGQTMGLGGLNGAAMALTNKANADKVEPFVELLKRVDADKQKNKTLAPQKQGAASLGLRNYSGAADEVTGLPMLIDKQGNVVAPKLGNARAVPKLTGENAGAVSRAVSAYKQMDELEPLIDKIAAKGKFGALPGSWEKFTSDQGLNTDPDIAELKNMISSVSKFGAGIHRQNSVESAKDIYNQIMLLKSSPEAMKAGLRAVRKAFVERGMIPGSEPYWASMGYDKEEIGSQFGIRKHGGAATPGVSPSKAKSDRRPTPMERSMSGVSGGSDLEKAKAALLKKIQGSK